SMQMFHCDITNGDTTNRHDHILDQIPNDDTVHTTEYGIKHGKQGEHNSIKMRYIFGAHMKRNIRLNQIPRNKNFDKFSQSDKTISEETKATNECKNNGNIMR